MQQPASQGFWRQFRALKKRTQLSIGCGFLIASLIACSCISSSTLAAINTIIPPAKTTRIPDAPTATPTQVSQIISTTTPTQ